MAINKNRESKDSSIKIRISATEKAEYQKKAARYGTTLTNYILLALEYSNPIFLKVEGSQKLAANEVSAKISCLVSSTTNFCLMSFPLKIYETPVKVNR